MAAADRALDALDGSGGTIVLVEGDSDAAAVSMIAARLDTAHARTLRVLSAHGVTNYRHLLTRIRAEHGRMRVVGLYDEPEEQVVARALESSGVGVATSRVAITRLGFHACVSDLEDEMIRAIGVGRVERLIEAEGELDSFRILQRQPAHRDQPVDQQLRRFLGTRSMRKIRYGHLLASIVDLDACPSPLRRVVLA